VVESRDVVFEENGGELSCMNIRVDGATHSQPLGKRGTVEVSNLQSKRDDSNKIGETHIKQVANTEEDGLATELGNDDYEIPESISQYTGESKTRPTPTR